MSVSAPPPAPALEPSRLGTVFVGARVQLQRHDGQRSEVTGKAAVLLALLALEGATERRRLALLLWPDSEEGLARGNLRTLVHRVNQRAGGEILCANGSNQELAQVRVHIMEVDSLLTALESEGAQGCELLATAGVEAVANEPLLEWLEAARQRWRRRQLAALSGAVADAMAEVKAGGPQAQAERAIALARACVQLEPLREQWHRQLMDTLAQCGDRAAALQAYEDCRQQLREQLGVLPDLQTRTVQLRILQEQAQAQPEGMVPSAQRAPEADGLTVLGGAARYPLVERESVLALAEVALKQGQHVVVQGEPGVGKTRLLRHLAAAAGDGAETVAVRSELKQEPYSALAQLLQEVHSRRSPRIGAPEQVELARLAPLAFAGVQPSQAALSTWRLHAALRHWFAGLGDAGVRVLTIDDVHDADAASQTALAALLDEPEGRSGQPALLLGYRSAEIEAVLDDATTQAQARHRARRIELPRLTMVGVRALLSAMDPAQRSGEPEALAGRLLKRTGGNPLFVIELAQQALEHAVAADVSSVQALLGARVKGCGTEAQQLAAVGAVAADDFTVDLAEAVMGLPALVLMPAWGELQQRGLFADHGLAHDLVKDAVLATLPQAIRRQLHRKVALHFEGQGLQGAVVLRHFLAADEPDRALPHALRQFELDEAAGLPTRRQRVELLGLLERCSDAVLMNNLWFTAELDFIGSEGYFATELLPRLRALRLRVERLPEQAASAAWLALVAAVASAVETNSFKESYELLARAADRMPVRGIERAHVEAELAELSLHLTGKGRIHLERANHALDGLPDQPSVKRLRQQIDLTGTELFGLDMVGTLRSLAGRRRAAQRRRDLAAVAQDNFQMAYLQSQRGSHARSFRHFSRYIRLGSGSDGSDDSDGRHDVQMAGVAALNSGHFQMALRLFSESEGSLEVIGPIVMALCLLRLGHVEQARTGANRVSMEAGARNVSFLLARAHCLAELDRLEGRDPVPGLRQHVEQAHRIGLRDMNLQLVTWEVTLRTQGASQRLGEAEALLVYLRQAGGFGGRHVRLMLEVAEARAEANAAGSLELAAEAARQLRRGCTHLSLYLPEGLVRCARLLRQADPREAAALVHVARRWVRQALEEVPPESRESFVHNVAVHRLLLGEDEQAVYNGLLQ